MTALPDWLVERAALDEIPPASRERVERANAAELAARIATLREDNTRELASHPAAPALAQIEARVATLKRRRARRRLMLLGIAAAAAAAIAIVVVARPPRADAPTIAEAETTRVKGATRLVAFRQHGDDVERLEQDALVRAGDVIQLRYNGGGRGYGLIASIDGAGVVTLHFPLTEDGSTALSSGTTTLPNAYALDDAPRFERFFFITANEPIDLQQSLAALRAFARRADSATASPDLPPGLRQWSLRLRKPK